MCWLGAKVAALKGYGRALGIMMCVLAGPLGLVGVILLPDLKMRQHRRVLDAVDSAVFPDR